MSKEHIELGAAAVIVVVVLAAVVLIAMSLLSNADEPAPEHAPGFTIPIEYEGPTDASQWCSAYASAQEAFNWPYRSGWTATEIRGPEPIRETFRQMLEGGPDYRG